MSAAKNLINIETGIWRTPSGRYKAFWRDPIGHQRARTFKRIKEARAFREQMRVQVRSGDQADPSGGKERLADAAKRWLATKATLKPKTYATYRSDLKYVVTRFGPQPIGSIGRAQVQQWVIDLGNDGVGAATIRKAFAALHGILEETVLAGAVTRNAASKVKLPREERWRAGARALTPQQVQQLADAIDSRYRALVLVGAYLGLRWAECAGLRRDDVDFEHRTIRIARSLSEVGGRLPASFDHIRNGNLYEVTTKNGRVRVLGLPDFLCIALARHMAIFPARDGLLFSSPQGGPLRANVYRRRFLPALKASGIDPELCVCARPSCSLRHAPRYHFHDLRHTAASIASSPSYGAAPAKLVQNWLGHSTQQVTTETYTHLYPQDFSGFVAVLDRVYEEAGKQLADDASATRQEERAVSDSADSPRPNGEVHGDDSH